MTVKRIVSNIKCETPQAVANFYADLFDLNVVMDQGWIITLASGDTANVQVSMASEGGSGTDVPDMSIEVTDIDDTYARAKAAGHTIAYEIRDEPWGVRRFYVVDPAGKVLNVLAHL